MKQKQRDNHSIQRLRINYAASTRRISFKLAVMTYRSIHDTSPSYMYLQSCFTCVLHSIQTTAAVFYLTSSGRSARSSLYSRQAGVSGFYATVWNDLPLHVASAPSLAVFKQRLETSVFPFLPRHYHIHHYCQNPNA